MRLPTIARILGGSVALALLPAGSAWAHAFGGRYDLPLPLSYYQLAAGLTVLLSFIALAFVARPRGTNRWLKGRSLCRSRYLQPVTSSASAVLYLFIAGAALFGAQQVLDNIAPVFVWVWVWVGVAFLSAVLGDAWIILNPFPAFGRLIRARRRYRLPAAVGRWPAFTGFLVFAWLELVSGIGEQPFMLGVIMLLYLGWMLAGMSLFGIRAWLDAADVFHNVFGLFARFGILRVRWNVRGRITVRAQFPGTGLVTRTPVHVSQTAIVIALLALVSFDGLLETPTWLATRQWIENSPAWRPLLLAVHGAGINLLLFVKTLALLAAPLLFALAYATCVLLMRLSGGHEVSSARLFNGFALTLVPIATVYHLAHYLSYLVVAGQQLIPLLSDPFGIGWNLFGTAGYTIQLGWITPKTVWIFSAIAIVTGHVVSVGLAHWQALHSYRSTRRVILSQVPMVILMVAYTMTSLWILSQPIIEAG